MVPYKYENRKATGRLKACRLNASPSLAGYSGSDRPTNLECPRFLPFDGVQDIELVARFSPRPHEEFEGYSISPNVRPW